MTRMKAFFLILMALIGHAAYSQQSTLMRPIPELAFANFERNEIQFPGDSNAFEALYCKLDTLIFEGKGQISILHIGGSHVQAGVMTQAFRNDLLTACPGITSGFGILFPFSAGKTNNPSGYFTRYTGQWSYCRNALKTRDSALGLCGAAIRTNDTTASITIITRSKIETGKNVKFDFNSFSVIGYSDDSLLMPAVYYDDSLHTGIYDPEQSTYKFDLPYYTDSISIRLVNGNGISEFTITGILIENGMPGITVHGAGANGASVSDYLTSPHFERDLKLIKPDLVIFGIGINDASGPNFSKEQFKNNYATLIRMIQKVNEDCALLFISNNDSYKRIRRNQYRVNENGKIAEEAFLEMGKAHNAGVWDQFDIMGGLYSMREWQEEGLAQKTRYTSRTKDISSWETCFTMHSYQVI
jgi:hypothetical protein